MENAPGESYPTDLQIRKGLSPCFGDVYGVDAGENSVFGKCLLRDEIVLVKVGIQLWHREMLRVFQGGYSRCFGGYRIGTNLVLPYDVARCFSDKK